jgi:transposase
MSAHEGGSEVGCCGKRRRRWTGEQKRRIVAESMEPGASAGMVARRHGLSCGQFYAWRQDLVLCGALGAGAAAGSTSRLEDGETTTAASLGAVTVPALLASNIPATPVGGPAAAGSDGPGHHADRWRVGAGERRFR